MPEITSPGWTFSHHGRVVAVASSAAVREFEGQVKRQGAVGCQWSRADGYRVDRIGVGRRSQQQHREDYSGVKI